MKWPVRDLCLTLGAWLLAASAASGAPPMVFTHLDAGAGLPQNTVMSTLQDSRGFIWLATEDGLSRFDGYDVRRYGRERDNPAGLGSSFIWAIDEDPDGDLWLATKDGGVARWLRHSDRFQSYRYDPANSGSLSSDSTRTLIVDRAGHVWVGTTGGGLNEIVPSSGAIRRYRHDPQRDDSLASDVVTALHEDAKGNLWVGTADGLHLLLRESGTFRRYGSPSQSRAALSSQKISSIASDRDGVLWIGTYEGGLNQFDLNRETVTTWRANAADAESLGSDEVRAVLVDSSGRLWIGTASGLHLMDRSGRLKHYAHDPAVPTSLRDNYVMSLYEDHTGMLWVGTRAGGVSRWNPRSWAFGHQHPAWLGDAYVMSFADDSAGRLWVGTLGNGLHRFDPQSGAHETLTQLAGRSLPDSRVMSLLTDRAGNLWIGTMSGGLGRLTPDNRLQVFRARPEVPTALSADGIMSMLETQDGRIWLGTFGGGINILDPRTETFHRISYDPRDPSSISAPRATAIAQDRAGFIWVGTDGGGLNLLAADGRLLRVFRHAFDDPASLSADTVYSLHVDERGTVWVGTDGGGLDRVVRSGRQPSAIQFQNVSKMDGLASDIIYGIRSDSSGKLWLSSSAGLTRYDPATGRTTVFHREQGLQSEDFNFGSHFRTRGGLLAFGGANGFNLFNPSQLDSGAPPPRVVLTNVEVMNHPAQTDAPYPELSSLALGYRDTVVSFEFAALDYAAPAKNRYQYRLSGFDADWIELGTRRRVSYTNLDAGRYVLEVRAASPESPWSEVTLALPVTVEPAPWLTPWAKVLYALVVLLLALVVWRTQQRKLHLAAAAQQRLEQQVAERTVELRDRNAELARMSRAKSAFLSRMSHEIRTPLNGVLGTVELLGHTPMSPRQTQLVDNVQSSARSLLAILNEILDLAKVEAGKIALETSPFDVGDLVENTVAAVAPLAESKGLELCVSVPPEGDCRLVGDPQRLRQVVLNLVGNAIKFTERGEISVRASLVAAGTDRARVEIAVRDTGIGMPASVAEQIFEPFSQADESTTRRYGGTGLGLSICREFVSLMGGTIDVASQQGVGTIFTVRLELPRAAAEPEAPSDALQGVVVRLTCRRAVLRESLERQLAVWGVTVEPEDTDRSTARTVGERRPVQAWIVDIDGADANVDALPGRRGRDGAVPLVLLASSATIVGRGLEQRFGQESIVAKPVRRDALYRALAVAAGRDIRPRDEAAPARPSPTQRLAGHVLVAEDNPVNALVAEGMLQMLGCTAKVVADGRSAVTQALAQYFDLVLMDVHMPEVDGLSAARLIRQEHRGGRRVPIVALTASAVESDREECLRAGMDDFLAKPFTFDEFSTVLGRYLPSIPVEAAPPATDEPIVGDSLDATTIARIRNLQRPDQPNLLGRVLSLYAKSSRLQMSELRAAVDARDLPAVAKLAHSLKSSSANVGASEVARLALALERAGVDGDADAVCRLIDSLVAAHDETLASLGRLIEENAA